MVLGHQISPVLAFFLHILRNKMPITYVPVTRLQARGYNAECFWLFHFVVEGSGTGTSWTDRQTDGRTDDGFLLLAGFSCDV